MEKPTSILDDEASYRGLIASLTEPDISPELVPEVVVRYRTEAAQLMIEEDISRGVLPDNLTSFADLHAYMDANMYLLDEKHPVPMLGSFYGWNDLNTARIVTYLNMVIDALNRWIAGGRQGLAASYIHLPQ
jgi:hypothetical protein